MGLEEAVVDVEETVVVTMDVGSVSREVVDGVFMVVGRVLVVVDEVVVRLGVVTVDEVDVGKPVVGGRICLPSKLFNLRPAIGFFVLARLLIFLITWPIVICGDLKKAQW